MCKITLPINVGMIRKIIPIYQTNKLFIDLCIYTVHQSLVKHINIHTMSSIMHTTQITTQCIIRIKHEPPVSQIAEMTHLGSGKTARASPDHHQVVVVFLKFRIIFGHRHVFGSHHGHQAVLSERSLRVIATTCDKTQRCLASVSFHARSTSVLR